MFSRVVFQDLIHRSTDPPKQARTSIIRVDLIVLLVCFGMLAVLAVPRHLNLSSDVRRSAAGHLARSVVNSVEFAHSLWRAEDGPSELVGPRGVVDMVNGYPTAATVDRLLEDPEMMGFNFQAGQWQHAQAPAGDVCAVVYQPPNYFGDTPVIQTDLSGC